jgi:MoaA/NifB/PqqE/SkfB family radical SAM enzyme/GT2 family glycosyltransferase
LAVEADEIMKKKMPLVSVITVNYNGKRLLADCFKSLLNLNYPRNKLEIFMVDNGSQDSSLEYVRKKFPTVKIIINAENNYALANNLGIKAAKGEYIALINNDVKVDKNWLIKLVEAAQSDISIGAVGSRILFMDGSIQSVGHQEYPNFYWSDIGFGEKDVKQYDIAKEVISICGCSVLYKRKCLKEIGLFDEDFNMFMEDVDMSIRCRKRNWRLITCPESVIYHKFHSTIGNEDNARQRQEINRLLLIAKHWPEKLADALYGKGYFTALKDHAYENVNDISEVLGRVYVKLIKEHGLELSRSLSPDLFKAVRKIYNFEKDHLISEVKNKNLVICNKDKEVTALKKDLERLRERSREELSNLGQQKIQEIALREQRIAALSKEIESFWKKYNEDVTSLQEQKDQELSLRDQQIVLLQQEMESLKQKHDQSLSLLRQNYDKEVAARDRQITSLKQDLEALKQKYDEALTAKENTISELRQELINKDNLMVSKDKEIITLTRDLMVKNRDLNNIYKSTGYKYLLKPLWDFLWAIKKHLIKAKNLIIFSRAKYLQALNLCREILKTGAGISQISGFLLFNKSLRRAYLSHLKYDTFPLMPKRLILMITRHCNLKCEFCDVPAAEKKEKTMQKEDAFRVIDSAARLCIKEIILTGGEPLLHPHLFEIADFANSKNISITLTTNGTLIKSNIERILKSKFSCICISIDGKEDTHDNLRNQKGAYKDTMDAIELLRQHRINIAINFVVTNKNIYELEEIYDYFSARSIRVFFFPVVNKPDLFVMDKKERNLYLHFIGKLFRKGDISIHEYKYLKNSIAVYFSKKDMPVRCLGLNLELGIDTDGLISPCCVWENKKEELNNLGNVFKEDLEELWFSPEFHKARLSIFNKGCENCFNPSVYELTQLTGLNYLVKRKTEENGIASGIRTEYLTKPNHVHFRFTSRCNLSCKHCDIWKNAGGDNYKRELSFEEWRQGIDKLYNWLGRFKLDLAGGEILLYKDAVNLIEYCAHKGIYISLTTNATLIDEAIAERLVNSGLYAINLSLDGLSQVHEYIRNKKGLYSKVEEAAFNLLGHRKLKNPYVALATVITKYNIEELQDMMNLVQRWGLDGIIVQVLDHNFGAKYYNDWHKDNEFWPDDYHQVEAAIDNLINAKKSGAKICNSFQQLSNIKKYYRNPADIAKYKCTTGDINFIVDEYGGLRLCWNMEPIGNILTQDPKEIWHSKLASQKRKEIYACLRTCRLLNCNYGR